MQRVEDRLFAADHADLRIAIQHLGQGLQAAGYQDAIRVEKQEVARAAGLAPHVAGSGKSQIALVTAGVQAFIRDGGIQGSHAAIL